MNDLPQPFWALCLAVMGAILGVIAVYSPAPETSRQALFQIASALVSGALGAFAGSAHSKSITTGDNATLTQPQDDKTK